MPQSGFATACSPFVAACIICIALGALPAQADVKRVPFPSAKQSESPDVIEKQPETKPAAPGSSQQWDDILITLKNYSMDGTSVLVALAMENQSDKRKTVSSVVDFHAESRDEQTGELNRSMSDCDGLIPPNSTLSCRLLFTFKKATRDVSLRIGTGLLTEAIYFELGARSE